MSTFVIVLNHLFWEAFRDGGHEFDKLRIRKWVCIDHLVDVDRINKTVVGNSLPAQLSIHIITSGSWRACEESRRKKTTKRPARRPGTFERWVCGWYSVSCYTGRRKIDPHQMCMWLGRLVFAFLLQSISIYRFYTTFVRSFPRTTVLPKLTTLINYMTLWLLAFLYFWLILHCGRLFLSWFLRWTDTERHW